MRPDVTIAVSVPAGTATRSTPSQADVAVPAPEDRPDISIEALTHFCISDAGRIAGEIHRRSGGSLELDELVSLAQLGLVTAASAWQQYCDRNSFDPYRIEYFRTYASRRIRGCILDALRSSDWATRNQRTIVKRMTAAGYGAGLSLQETSQVTGYTLPEMQAALLGVSRRPVPLDGIDVASEESPSNNVLSRNTEDAIRSAAAVCIASLPGQQQVVLALRYYALMPLSRIATTLAISGPHASRLHAAAVTAVHRAMLAAAIVTTAPETTRHQPSNLSQNPLSVSVA
jgi:RNA polymerase sigma factor for flagellar operon FliA